MVESFSGGNPVIGIIGQHHAQQFYALGFQPQNHLIQRYGSPIWERLFELLQLGHSWPYFFIGRPQSSKNLVQLVDLTVPGEHGLFGDHLCENHPNRPDIHGHGVLDDAEQDFRGAVPQCNNFVGVRSQGELESPCKSEVGNF